MASLKNESNLIEDLDVEQSNNVFWTPPLSVSSTPNTILLGLWPHARSEQIEHYTECYKALYPSATIVQLPHSDPAKHIAEVLDALIQHNEKSQIELGPERVLMHVFGNSAADRASQLLQRFKARTGRRLQVKAIVFDAEPSISSWSLSEIFTVLPKRAVSFLYELICSIAAWIVSLISFGYIDTAFMNCPYDLHDAYLVSEDALRCYVWPAKQRIFAWIPSLQEGVRERLEYTVKRYKVDGSSWSMDQEMYWSAIEEVWRGAEQLK